MRAPVGGLSAPAQSGAPAEELATAAFRRVAVEAVELLWGKPQPGSSSLRVIPMTAVAQQADLLPPLVGRAVEGIGEREVIGIEGDKVGAIGG
jgi:hypothetical protein